MIQPETQKREYWAEKFTITDADIEQIYNSFLEAERPQLIEQITKAIFHHRVAAEKNRIKQLLPGRSIYQPAAIYEVGDKLLLPVLRFATGEVTAVRDGFDPQLGSFRVIAVEINGRVREFASALEAEHLLNVDDPTDFEPFDDVDADSLYEQFGHLIQDVVAEALQSRPGFVRLGNEWFVRELMAEVNVGHLHLAEAVLEVNEGGPLLTDEILVHLDMDEGLDIEVRRFSLNHALLNDKRFDEVAPPGQVMWFLERIQPEAVRKTPERLQYEPLPYERALLTPQLLLLERELDDEWSSDLPPADTVQPTILSLTYPHRWAGTLPLSSRIKPLFPTAISPRQRVTFIDEKSKAEIIGWVVQDERYIFGLAEWYDENKIPIGGFITLKPGPEAGVILLDFDRRKDKREWVRLANVVENRITFELDRRDVGCGYDDLLVVGTDYVAALDAFARRITANKRSIASLLQEILPELARLNPQGTVHAKTLYSALNMVKRTPPGPLFAELAGNSLFKAVGDHYWQMKN